MKFLDHAGKIDLTGWNLTPGAEMIAKIEKELLNAIHFALKEIPENAYIYFPKKWDFGKDPGDGVGGNPVSDPMTIYMRLPFDSGGEFPTFSFNLREPLKSAIEGHAEGGDGGRLDDDGRKVAHALRAGLMDLVSWIDSALARSE